MIINNNENNNGRVNFISYTGKYSNLCMGILTVEIDGKKVIFDSLYFASFCDEPKSEDKLSELYGSFWYSGGNCGCINNSELHVSSGEWVINRDLLPEKYKDLAEDFDRIFNDNVPLGCCGGCLCVYD